MRIEREKHPPGSLEIHFPSLSVARRGLAIVVEFIDGPKQSACDEVEINLVLHGFIVMPQGGSENPGFAIVVRPNTNVVFLGILSVSLSQGSGVGPDFFNLVKFAIGSFPGAGKSFHDGMIWLEVFDFNRAMAFVADGSHAQKFAPFVGAGVAETVHGAVNHHSGQTFLMDFSDGIDEVGVAHISEAFIMNNDIVAISPMRGFKSIDFNVGAGPALEHVIELDPGSRADPLGENSDLIGIIMAASTGDDQRPDRGGSLVLLSGGRGEAGPKERGGETSGGHAQEIACRGENS
jgi:hypothetical protein